MTEEIVNNELAFSTGVYSAMAETVKKANHLNREFNRGLKEYFDNYAYFVTSKDGIKDLGNVVFYNSLMYDKKSKIFVF